MTDILNQLKKVSDDQKILDLLNEWSGYPWYQMLLTDYFRSIMALNEHDFIFYDKKTHRFINTEGMSGVEFNTKHIIPWLKKNTKLKNFQ